MRSRAHEPLGPGGTWKTGQRVPTRGTWVDQYGEVTHFDMGTTFPPCIGRKRTGALRRLIKAAKAV